MTALVRRQELDAEQREGFRTLWNASYPASLEFKTAADADHYLDGLQNVQHWLIEPTEGFLFWAATFTRDGATWFAIIVDSTLQRTGIGSAMLGILKRHHDQLNGWVIDHDNALKTDGSFYSSPLDFYLKNDFVLTPERLEIPTLSAVKIVWEK